MPIETSTYIDGLVPANPANTDGLSGADDHLRLLKSTITNTFPNITGAVTATQDQLNSMSGFTGTTADLDYGADLRATGVTAVEFGYLSGVTSDIQTQLGTKQDTITGAATTIVSSDLTTDKALISDGSGKVSASTVTSAELGYLSGVTSNIQTQLSSAASGTQPTRQEFYTGQGSWTKPAGCKYIKVTVVGGGGGSAYVSGTAGTGPGPTGHASGGGGGGATVIKWIDVTDTTPYGALNYTVGTGGAGGTSGSPNGSNGTQSKFNAQTSAFDVRGNGGSGAVTGTFPAGLEGGIGGAAGFSGDINIGGQAGANVSFGTSPSSVGGIDVYLGGAGGSSTLGAGGYGGSDGYSGAISRTASSGSGYGYGGGGGGNAQFSTGSKNGVDGANGIIIVEEYY